MTKCFDPIFIGTDFNDLVWSSDLAFFQLSRQFPHPLKDISHVEQPKLLMYDTITHGTVTGSFEVYSNDHTPGKVIYIANHDPSERENWATEACWDMLHFLLTLSTYWATLQ